jgi:hypothetical protein
VVRSLRISYVLALISRKLDAANPSHALAAIMVRRLSLLFLRSLQTAISRPAHHAVFVALQVRASGLIVENCTAYEMCVHMHRCEMVEACYSDCAWSEAFSILMTSEKSKMVTAPCRAPMTATLSCHCTTTCAAVHHHACHHNHNSSRARRAHRSTKSPDVYCRSRAVAREQKPTTGPERQRRREAS